MAQEVTRRVAKLVGLEESYIHRFSMSSRRARNPETDRLVVRFFGALVLTDVLQEVGQPF